MLSHLDTNKQGLKLGRTQEDSVPLHLTRVKNHILQQFLLRVGRNAQIKA